MAIISIVKESRKGEKRVALMPLQVKKLIKTGHQVLVEAGAGLAVGIADEDYVAAGASMITLNTVCESALSPLLGPADVLLRVKRAERSREIIENQVLKPGSIMVGFLDLLDTTTPHVAEWQAKQITTHSLDMLNLSKEDPMNVLARMSEIAGRLAVDDALLKLARKAQHALILGKGSVGQAAYEQALKHGLSVSFLGSRETQDKAQLNQLLQQADIVITSARRSGEKAPLLIDSNQLMHMQAGSVIVDLARTEGGNVQGSLNDDTVILGNDIIVTNNTGYPKKDPVVATQAYAAGMLCFLESLLMQH